jgi:tetratricopeptide (TPR) repeat protein
MVEITELTNDQAVDALVDEWEKKQKEQTKNTQSSSKNTSSNGEPELPPQLAEVSSKSTEEIMAELNKLPFFMNNLNYDEDDETRPEIEALKSLAYEGEPDEIAENFKKQGNDQYRVKQYKNAVEFYTKGIDIECGDKYIEAALYLNRAACNLELKNYRKCINDAKQCLVRQPKNVKALFRAAKAFFAIELYDEAKQVLEFAYSIDTKNAAVNALIKTVDAKIKYIEDLKQKKRKREEERLKVEQNLQKALDARGITSIHSSYGTDTIGDAKIHLEDSHDIETQLIIPTIVIYPTVDEFDVISEVSELTSPLELMELVMDRPESYFQDGKHTNFRPKKLEAYMETEDGGLVKIPKKNPVNQVLMSQKPKIPLFDNILRIYFVPKVDSADWIAKWKKQDALAKRE